MVINSFKYIYGVGFDNIDEKIDSASYYFTPEGYASYLKALETSGFRNDIVRKN